MTLVKNIDSRIARKLASLRQPFRGVISAVNSAPNVALVQVAGVAGETVQDNELMQDYGYSSNPPVGSHCIVVPLGGKTSQGVIVATEHGAYRIKSLQSGEVAIYTDEGDSIVLKRGHLIEVTTQTLKITATTKVEMVTPLLQITGGDVKADAISLKTHKSSSVTPGSGQSGVPV